MVALFHDLMHKEIEVYVDGTITKSVEPEDHITFLEKLFTRQCHFHLQLNPNKCTFMVTSGNFLGFIVSHRGIEVDPSKAHAIIDMPLPQN